MANIYWNVIRVDSLLLGESPESIAQAMIWQEYYEKKYPGQKFTLVMTTERETCDFPRVTHRQE